MLRAPPGVLFRSSCRSQGHGVAFVDAALQDRTSIASKPKMLRWDHRCQLAVATPHCGLRSLDRGQRALAMAHAWCAAASAILGPWDTRRLTRATLAKECKAIVLRSGPRQAARRLCAGSAGSKFRGTGTGPRLWPPAAPPLSPPPRKAQKHLSSWPGFPLTRTNWVRLQRAAACTDARANPALRRPHRPLLLAALRRHL